MPLPVSEIWQVKNNRWKCKVGGYWVKSAFSESPRLPLQCRVSLWSCWTKCSASFPSLEAWRWLRTEPWKTRRRWRSRRCSSKKPNTLPRKPTANTRRYERTDCIYFFVRCRFSWCSTVISFQVARKLVILEGELERAEERAEIAEL